MDCSENWFKQKIRNRMFKQFLVSLSCVMIVVGVVLNYLSYSIVQRIIYQKAKVNIELTYEHFKEWVSDDSAYVKFFGDFISGSNLNAQEIAQFIQYEENRFSIKAPYVAYTDGSYIDPSWDIPEDFDSRSRPWYIQSMAFFSNKDNFNSLYYSTPYISQGTGKMVLTVCSAVIKNNEIVGVVGLDVLIEDVEENLEIVEDFKGSGYLVSKSGVLLASGKDIEELGSNIGDTALGQVYRDFLVEEKKVLSNLIVLEEEEDSYFFIRDYTTGWVIFFKISNSSITSQVRVLNWVLFGGAILVLIVFAVIISFVARRFTKPIVTLAEGAGRIAQGEFDVRVETDLQDELGYLTHSFNFMAAGLKEREQMKKIQVRLDSELLAGQNIQMSMLPKELIDSSLFSSYAMYSSAREVSGDFYDFFEVSDDCVVFSIGDVSGKGVPAAMFMTMTCTLLRAICPKYNQPDVALKELNNAIALHNDENMFVTVFLAYYNPKTGVCRYANGGHNPPLIIRNSLVTELKKVRGILIGVFTGAEFESAELKLNHGDGVLLFTDGVTEAQGEDCMLYGDDRLRKLVVDNCQLGVEELANIILEDVQEFQDRKQFDDITLLLWQRS